MHKSLWYTFRMPIFNDIKTQLAAAMRAKDAVRLNTLRGIKTAFANELVAQKRSTNDTLSDDEALAVIRRLVKQRKDSIEQFRKGGREELARAEEAELKILETFLPAQMSEDEIRKIAEGVKAKLGVTDLPAPNDGQAGKAKLGQLIGAVLKETKGRADGAVVKKIVETLFN